MIRYVCKDCQTNYYTSIDSNNLKCESNNLKCEKCDSDLINEGPAN